MNAPTSTVRETNWIEGPSFVKERDDNTTPIMMSVMLLFFIIASYGAIKVLFYDQGFWLVAGQCTFYFFGYVLAGKVAHQLSVVSEDVFNWATGEYPDGRKSKPSPEFWILVWPFGLFIALLNVLVALVSLLFRGTRNDNND